MAADPADPVRYEVRGGSATLTIDRPDRRNALNDEVVDGLLAGLERAGSDHEVRCVVLTGAGDRAFCAGGDLTGTMSPSEARVQQHGRRGRLGDLLVAVGRHPLPVVARVNGVALAGGFGLMLACDLAVAADDVEVGTPETNLGLWPFMISAVIARNIPRKIAVEMMLTGRRVPVLEAERWGMVNRVVPRKQLDQTVDQLVDELSSKSPVALRLGKESFFRAQDMGFEESLDYLNAMLTVDLQSEDVAEGVSAFLQKRKPEWRGG
ncbi:MAG: enoyl-CoA hydratase/isomerase family protein [Actinomycetota bacterium]